MKDEGEGGDNEDQDNGESNAVEGQGESPCLARYASSVNSVMKDAEGKEETTDAAPKDDDVAPSKGAEMSERAASTTIERATVDWADLTMEQKLEALHALIEWQFQNPLRLRQLMKSDDEGATWVRGLRCRAHLHIDTPRSVPSPLVTTGKPTHTG